MKKILLTLAKWFHIDLTEIKYVEVEKVVEVPVERIVEKQIALEGTVEGDVTVEGDLLVKGTLTTSGACTCLCAKTESNGGTTTRKRNAKGQFVKEG